MFSNVCWVTSEIRLVASAITDSILYVVKTHETKVFLLEKVGQLTPGQIKTQKLDVV